MPIDVERLRRLRRYEDPRPRDLRGVRRARRGWRALLRSALRSARGPRPLGWVISPSIGPEHGNLRRLETLLARDLATAGFPTLRIRPDLHPVSGAGGEIDLPPGSRT